MAEEKQVRILHISDLHINKTAVPGRMPSTVMFHDELLEHILSKIKPGDVDYLICSGDLGDQCLYENVEEATIWLTKLRDRLKLTPEKVFIASGNHDIQEPILPMSHHKKRMDFATARHYKMDPTGGYNNNVFDWFTALVNTVSTNTGPKIVFEPTDTDVRFILINSSWLTQERKAEKTNEFSTLSTQAMATNKPALEMIKQVKDTFNVACCESKTAAKIADPCIDTPDKSAMDPAEWDKICKDIYAKSLRYSENVTQQLLLTPAQIKELNDIPEDDGKINIVIFHHPQGCLHMFDRHLVSSKPGSGVYRHVLEKGNVLFCGHIHPADIIRIGEGSLFELPMCIAGKASNEYEFTSVKRKDKKYRPLYGMYTFTKTSNWELKRKLFGLKTEFDKTRTGDLSYIKQILLDVKPEPDRPDADVTPYKFPRKRKIRSVIAGAQPISNTVPGINLNTDHDYKVLKENTWNWVSGEYQILLNSYAGGAGVYHRHDLCRWIDVLIDVEPAPKKLVNYLKFTPTAGSHLTQEVIIAPLFSDELFDVVFVQNWLKAWQDDIGEDAENEGSKIIFIPLFIDLMYGLIDRGYATSYLNDTKLKMELQYSREPTLPSQFSFPSLFSRLNRVPPTGKQEIAGNLSKFVFFTPELLTLLQSGGVIPDSEQLLTYDGTDRILSVKKVSGVIDNSSKD